MPLDDAGLKTDLTALYDDTLESAATKEEARDAFINGLVDAFHKYVASATVVYTSGLEAGDNIVTGTFEGELQ